LIDYAWKDTALKAWEWLKEQEYDPMNIIDDNEVRNLYLEAWLVSAITMSTGDIRCQLRTAFDSAGMAGR